MSELIKALVAARKEIGSAKKGNVNPHFKSKYADLASVIEAVKEPLERHGLAFVQDIANGCVTTVILHESGEEKSFAPFPLVTVQNTPQAAGSALTYARRYSLQTALGVPAEDDDGNEASKPKAPVIAPAKEAAKGIEYDIEKIDKIVSALIDFHSMAGTGVDTAYKAFELWESIDNEEKLIVNRELADYSKVRAWLKTVVTEHRKVAA